MSNIKNKVLAIILLVSAIAVSAQNTSSPYSMFGLGEMKSPYIGGVKAMGGVGIGLDKANIVNPSNPASYSSVDSMTFLMDVGFAASVSNIDEGDINQNKANGYLDYIAMKIPLSKKLGVSLGLLPLSNVGYSFNQVNELSDDISSINYYNGDGGLNSFYLGFGYSLFKSPSYGNLSFGANYKRVFGSINKTDVIEVINTNTRIQSWSLNANVFELGLQYSTNVGESDRMSLGFTYSPKTSFSSELNKTVYAIDTISTSSDIDTELPASYGVGLSYTFDKKLTLAADYSFENWKATKLDAMEHSSNNASRVAVGLEYLPRVIPLHYYQAIFYRAGLYYNSTNIEFGGDNLKKMGLTFGLGLPIMNNKSRVNVGFECGKILPPSSVDIKETYFKMNLGITFNEMWFFKRKFK